MSIYLGDGVHTLPPAADGRLRRILQVASDLTGKPLDQMRILDLACLEGHYAVEFALHGSQVVGIELREENLAKAEFVKNYLRLNRLVLSLDDVRNLSLEKYGEFDVVICSGILYHLDVPDVFQFVRSIYEVCTHLAIFDTQIALNPVETVAFENEEYHGIWYKEHDEAADRETKLEDVWASVDNVRSFWLTAPSLANLVAKAGFSSFYECLNPHHDVPEDRRSYAAIKGPSATVLSSPRTAEMGFTPKPEISPSPLQSQFIHKPVFLFWKQALPQPVKDAIKPILRKLRLLPPDPTPPYLRKRRDPKNPSGK